MTKQLKLIFSKKNLGFNLERAQTSERCSKQFEVASPKNIGVNITLLFVSRLWLYLVKKPIYIIYNNYAEYPQVQYRTIAVNTPTAIHSL